MKEIKTLIERHKEMMETLHDHITSPEPEDFEGCGQYQEGERVDWEK